MKRIFCLLFLGFATLLSVGQSSNPYHLNGSAIQENCNCYTLTPDEYTRSGSIWNINKISLNQPFDYNFNVFLGCDDAGADGIVFVLQPISTSVGTTGGGLGYENVSPSIGVAIDTWQNQENNDPHFDHVAIHRNGNINHTSADNLAGPVRALENSDNIEDCRWHTFRIQWDPASTTIRAYIDGSLRVSATLDLVGEVFNGDPMVFWGFTGSTGGAKNHQRVCTSLNPGFSFPAGQMTCFPEPIRFIDSSTSFGSILKWYWDFGDGTIDSSTSAPPPHVYAQPGEYDVQLRILGNNGCLSEPYTRKIVSGSEPQAIIGVEPGIVCDNSNSMFVDSSGVEFGTINKWNWVIGGQSFSDKDPPYRMPSQPVEVQASLQVETQEGCISATAQRTVEVLVSPVIDFNSADGCLGSTTNFVSLQSNPEVAVSQWLWNLGDGRSAATSNVTYRYSDTGEYQVQLRALAQNGCVSNVVDKTVRIYGTRADAGRDTLVADNQPLQLQGSGGVSYQWWPETGLSDPAIPNPIATVQNDITYILTASSPEGCPSTDTLNIKVYKGPQFYVPNAFTPNGDGRNDLLRYVAAGITTLDYFQVYNRYGQLVFRSTTLNQGWDGTLNGRLQDAGTYVWIIQGKDFNGNLHSKKGTVILIR